MAVRIRWWRSCLAAALAVPVAVGVVAPRPADAAPNLNVTVTAPAEVLVGSPITYSVTACNGTLTDGFNVGFRVLLPSGVTFSAAGAGTPAPDLVLSNQPAAGQQTVIWKNQSDMQAGVCHTISFTANVNPVTRAVGSTIAPTAEAYVNSDVRFVPDFNTTTGLPVVGSSTGSGTAGASTLVVPFILVKTALDMPENELLRGVHTQPRTFQLEVTNNATATPTTGVSVVDNLPPGLEYLGCDTDTDNTFAGAEEYAGSGPLAIGDAGADCVTPATIDTLADGTTRITWNLAPLTSPSEVRTITFAVGIALHANTDSWPNGKPAPAMLLQGRNLDNNTGAPTYEDATEPVYTNVAAATGTYTGTIAAGTNPFTSTDDEDVTSEDLAIQKAMTGAVIHGTTVGTDLTFEVSEYRDFASVEIVDTLPNGLCPVGAGDAECPAGSAPTISVNGAPAVPAPYGAGTIENSDGTWTLAWNSSTVPALAAVPANSIVVVHFDSVVRRFYQSAFNDTSAEVLEADSLTNSVNMRGLDSRRAVIGTALDPEPDGLLDFDASSAQIDGVVPTIDKQVATRASIGTGLPPSRCLPSNGASYSDAMATGFGPGDIACFKLRVNFPLGASAKSSMVRDYLPPGLTYVAGSTLVTVANNLLPVSGEPAVSGDMLEWELGNLGLVDDTGAVWEITFEAAVVDPTLGAAFDVKGNLQKYTQENTAGEVLSLRDDVDVRLSEAQLTLVKAILVGPGSITADPVGVQANDTVTYAVDVNNSGDLTATSTEVWDVLPAGITCADLVALSISDAGSCAAGVVKWTTLTVPGRATLVAPVGNKRVTYQVVVPSATAANQSYTNTAGVRTYETAANGDVPVFAYFPVTNIDASVPVPSRNAARADDTARIFAAIPLLTKTRTTSVTEAGNTVGGQATIGELVDYTVTLTIPQGTTLYAGAVTDNLPASLTNLTIESAQLNGAALPSGGVDAALAGQVLTISLPPAYTNVQLSGNDTVVVVVRGQVKDVGGPVRGNTIANTASLAYESPSGTPQTAIPGAAPNVTVVEPGVTITKADDTGGTPVISGQVVTYTLTVRNAAGFSTAHDIVVVDDVPVSLSGAPVPATVVGFPAATWDGDKLTWAPIASLAPGASTVLEYTVTVPTPIVAGSSFTNTATATTVSLSVLGARSYTTTAVHSLQAQEPTITKAVSPAGPLTIGDSVSYVVTVVIPANLTLYDASITDTLPDGVLFDSNAVGCAPACGFTPTTLTPVGRVVGAWLGDVIADPAPRTVTFVVNGFVDDVHVNASPVLAGNNLVNTAQLHWNLTDAFAGPPADVSGLPPTTDKNLTSNPVTTIVGEPVVAVDKRVQAVNGPINVEAGSTLTYSVIVSNTGATTAHDVVVVDDAPTVAGLDNTTFTLNDGGTLQGPIGNQQIVWIVPAVAPGTPVTVTYTVVLSPSIQLDDAQAITNTAQVQSYWGVAEAFRATHPTRDFRSYSGPPPDTATVTPLFPTLTVVKTALSDPTDARYGVPFTWRIVTTNTGPGQATSTVVSDTLPAGWVYVAGSSTITAPSGVTTVDPTGTTTLAWAPVALASGQSVTVQFQATPEAGTAVSGTDVTNNAAAAANDAGGDPANSSRPFTASGSAIAHVRQIDLSVTKSVSAPVPPIPYGANITYRVAVTNQGPDAATGVTLLDVLPAGLTYQSDDGAGAYNGVSGIWTVGSLALAQTATLHIVARITAAPALTPLAITNSIEVLTANQFDIDSTPNNSVPAEDDQASATFTPTPNTLGDYVWFDFNGDGVQDLDEPGIADVAVDALWAGPDGTFGNGDDVSVSTITDANGHYGFADLPVGTYRITVDDATLPFFMTPTIDRDGIGTPNVATLSFGGVTPIMDVDFGYRGTGSLGDFVWFDQNADGVQDVGEPAIENALVTVTWSGRDNVFGTTDDVVFPSVTTDIDGLWVVTNLPDGDYRVDIDPASLPVALAPTFDRDGVGTPDSAIVPVDLDDKRDVDFGYSGSGHIGDTIWFDADGNGLQDLWEPVLGDVDVTIVWHGPFGDLTYTTTTAGDGTYSFDHLPPGAYTVTVDTGTLPPGLTSPTFDLDGVTSPDTVDLTLALDEDNDGVDFGYRGLANASLGDWVWLDLDGDGQQQSGEPGLAGVQLMVIQAGTDLLFGTADDVVYTVTTDAAGMYSAPGLPAGSVTVRIVPSTLPAGVEESFDLDGLLDNQTNVDVATNGAPTNRVDVDFGYQGTHSVATRVWVDTNGNGLIDTDEEPIADVTVAVTWAGNDGVFGTADDVVLPSIITDDDGTASLIGVPAGAYRLTVDYSTVPATYLATADSDGGTLGTAVVTVDASATVPVAIFGYRPVSDIQITKTLDGSLVVGSPGVYVLTVTNAGPSSSGTDVQIVDELPEGLTYRSANGDGWTCEAAGQVVRCTRAAAITVATSSTVRIDVDVAAGAGRTINNTASVSGSVFDPDTSIGNQTGSVTGIVVSGNAGLPTTGGDVFRLFALAMTLVLVGGGLLGATRFTRRATR